MRSLRFSHVFAVLMVLAAACAFVIPTRISNPVRGNLQAMFYPVARPAHWLTTRISERLSPDKLRDDGAVDPNNPRQQEELLRELASLRVYLASLTGRIAQLEKLDAALASVGEVRSRCMVFAVVGPGADPAGRESLRITGTTGDGVGDGYPVLYGSAGGGGIAGRISAASATGSVVQLITDRGFRVNVGFARFVKTDDKVEFVVIATTPAQAEGDGRGALWIRNLSKKDAVDAGLKEGDWVILSDQDWDERLQRYRVGQISSIKPYSKGPLFVEIKVEPGTNLLKLSDVFVMKRG